VLFAHLKKYKVKILQRKNADNFVNEKKSVEVHFLNLLLAVYG